MSRATVEGLVFGRLSHGVGFRACLNSIRVEGLWYGDAGPGLRIKGLADQNHVLGFRRLRVGIILEGQAAGRSEIWVRIYGLGGGVTA